MSERMFVALFYSPSLAIRAEKVARKRGLEVKLIPTPRHLSSDCGTALRFCEEDHDEIVCILEDSSVDYDRIEEC